jgi:hypothetical protein
MVLQCLGLLCVALAALTCHTAAAEAAGAAASQPVEAVPAAAKMPMAQLSMEGPTLEMLARGYRGLASPALRNWRRLAMKLKTPGVCRAVGCRRTYQQMFSAQNTVQICNSVDSSRMRTRHQCWSVPCRHTSCCSVQHLLNGGQHWNAPSS